MNQTAKISRPAESAKSKRTAPPAPPQVAPGGITLPALSNSGTVRALKIKRQVVEQAPAPRRFRDEPSAVESPLPAAIAEQPGSRVDAPGEMRQEQGRMLNLLLADEYMLYKITRDYHWNVAGPDYHGLRLLFQLQHEEAARFVDDLAERVRAMHLPERISWIELKSSARCRAAAGFELPFASMLAELLRVHDQIMAQLRHDSALCRERYGDESAAEFLVRLREQHENSAWMLRAQLETTGAARLASAAVA